MRTTLIALAVAGATLSLGACQSGPRSDLRADSGTAPLTSSEPITSDTATLTVQGLGCPLCAHNIDKQLMEMPGVQRVSVDMGTGTVVAWLRGPRRPSPADFADAVERAGFTLVGVR